MCCLDREPPPVREELSGELIKSSISSPTLEE
jgi:hypothetical protein